MERKNILIIVRTEYQLLLAAHLLFTEFSDTDRYNVTLIFHIWKGVNRVKSSINFNLLPARCIILEVDYDKSTNNKNVRRVIKEILSTQFYKFIHFMEHSSLGYYFSDVLSRRGTIISLGQDGLKPYIRFNRSDLYWIITETIKIYYFLISNRLIVKSFNIVSKKYGYLKQTNELLLTHPEVYDNWSNKKLVKINLTNESNELEKLKALFEFERNGIKLKDNSIFFVNQPLPNLSDYEMSFLKRIRNKFPETTIYIKIHPLTSKSQLSLYNEIFNCTIIDTTIPAELYMSSLNNSIILSFWSTALLFKNKTCNYFWLYDLILNEGVYYEKMFFKNPTDYINVVKSFEYINFKSSIADE